MEAAATTIITAEVVTTDFQWDLAVAITRLIKVTQRIVCLFMDTAKSNVSVVYFHVVCNRYFHV